MFDAIFVKPLANILFLIYGIIPGHDYGLAVIIVTVLIRLALWPLIAKQLKSQKKLQQLQPEIAKLKKAANGDKQKESAALMELYKEKEINPLASCLPLLIQFPFLIALFALFSRGGQGFQDFQHLLYEPVKQLSYIQQVIAQPELFKPTLFGLVNLVQKHNLVLAVLAAATQFFQVRQITPRNLDKSDPSAATTQAMSWIFPLLTGYIGYTVVAALPLYWAVSNLVSIGQQSYIMRDQVDEMEEAEVVTTKVRTSGAVTAAKPKAKSQRKRGK